MICICYQRQLELLSRFQYLASNVGSSLVIPPELTPAIGALSSSATSANAALATASDAGASQAAAAQGTATAQAAAASALDANAQLQALSQLAALASSSAALQSSLGVDLSSPSAAGVFGSLGGMLADLLKTLAELPLYLLEKLSSLAQIGELVEKLKGQLDVDLEVPEAAKELGDAAANVLAQAKALAEQALKNAAAAPEGLAGSTQEAEATAMSASTAQVATKASADAVASATSSVQSGLGVDLVAPGAMSVLSTKLAAVKAGISGMPAGPDPASTALLLSSMKALAAIDTLRRTLGIDVLAQGAGSSLQSKLQGLASNLAGSESACAALDSAASLASSSSGNAEGSAALEGNASVGTSADAAAETSLGASAGAAASSAVSLSVAQISNLPIMSPALAQMMAGMPAVPLPWMLLSSFCTQVQSTLGIQLIAHGPCE